MPDLRSITRRNGPEVLVVEDDLALRELVALTLRREGLSVVTAPDGADAIDHLARRPFRVVLLDLMMPRVNGWDVIDWLKGQPAARPYSLIVATAADNAVFAELDPALVNAIFVKPFDVFDLAGYVHRCCDRRSDRDRRRKRVISDA